jgi:hypothetical protein
LLISTAADRATAPWDFTPLRGRRVYVDPALLESTDKSYVMHAVRTELLRDGACLVTREDEAEVIAEPSSGGMGHGRVRIPPGPFRHPLVVMGNGFTTPELALYKSSSQEGAAKLSITARDARTGASILAIQVPPGHVLLQSLHHPVRRVPADGRAGKVAAAGRVFVWIRWTGWTEAPLHLIG